VTEEEAVIEFIPPVSPQERAAFLVQRAEDYTFALRAKDVGDAASEKLGSQLALRDLEALLGRLGDRAWSVQLEHEDLLLREAYETHDSRAEVRP
jgi:hypothetical protein